MKNILISVALFILALTGAKAQVGIDLTEMMAAPDSGYMIITTGDQVYPDNGLQRYVKFDDMIPLEDMYQKEDSVCFRFAYQTADVCYEWISGGGGGTIQNLTVVRDNDTIGIKISGGNTIFFKDSIRTKGDIAQVARDSAVIPEYTFTYSDSLNAILRCTGGGVADTTWHLQFDGVDDYAQARNSSVFDVTTGDFDLEVDFRTSENINSSVRIVDKRGQGGIGLASSYVISPAATNNYENSGIDDGVGNAVGFGGFTDKPFPNDGQWHTARMTWENSTGTGKLIQDGIQLGQETNTSMIGNSISTSRKFTLGAANTSAQYFKGDIKSFRFGSETFPMNEGTGTVLTGSSGTKLDIHGATWGMDVVGGTICDTIYLSDIHVDTFYRSSDSLHLTLNDGRSFVLRDSFVNIAGLRDTMSMVYDSLALIRDSIAIHRTDISQNTTDINNHIAADNDLDPLNEIQQLTKAGSTISLSRGGGSVTDDDTVFDDTEIKDSLGVHRVEINNLINVGEGDTYLTGVQHIGDSVRFTMSDASTYTVRDSTLKKSDIDQWVQDGIPTRLFYTKIGGVTSAVNWDDVVEIEGGVVNVNHPAEINWDSVKQVLTICQFIFEYDTTITSVSDYYLDFNGTSDYMQVKAGSNVEWSPQLKATFKTDNTSKFVLHSKYAVFASNWMVNHESGNFGISATAGTYKSAQSFTIGTKYKYSSTMDGSDFVQKLNGTEFDRETSFTSPGVYTNQPFTMGFAQGNRWFDGQLYDFAVGSETWAMQEGSGSTITGSNGTVMNITGATWGSDSRQDTSIVVSDTIKMCDTINLSADTYVDTMYFKTDTFYLVLNNGKIYKTEIISGATQMLSYDTPTNTTTLSEGGGTFVINGDAGITVTLDALGEYTVSGSNMQGEKGDPGNDLEFDWSGTQLGVRQEGQTPYDYVDLEGDKGDKGDKGDTGDIGDTGGKGDPGNDLEFNWMGSELGVREKGDPTFTYEDLLGPVGPTGPIGATGAGKDLEFVWDDTKLGVRQEGDINYDYTELIGPKGDDGSIVNDRYLDTVYRDGDTMRFRMSNLDTFQVAEEYNRGWLTKSGEVPKNTTDSIQRKGVAQIRGTGLPRFEVIQEDNGLGYEDTVRIGANAIGLFGGSSTTANYFRGVSTFKEGMPLAQIGALTHQNDTIVTLWNRSGRSPQSGFANLGQFQLHKDHIEINQYGEGDVTGTLAKMIGVTQAGKLIEYDTIGLERLGITPSDTTRWGAGGAAPWEGTYPDPYLTSSSATVRIGSSAATSAKLRIDNSGSNLALDINQSLSNREIVRVTNSEVGAQKLAIFGNSLGVSLQMVDKFGVETFNLLNDGRLFLNNSISLSGSVGNSSQVLFGGSSPSWGYIPSQTDYNFTAAYRNKLNSVYNGAQVNVQSDWNATFGDSYIKNKPSISGNIYSLTKNDVKIDFKENGTLISNIKFAATGGLSVHGNTAATITFDGSGIGGAWKTTGQGNIYRNTGGVTIGSTGIYTDQFSLDIPTRFNRDATHYAGSSSNYYPGSGTLAGSIYAGASGLVVKGGSGKDVVLDSGDDILMTAKYVDMTNAYALLLSNGTDIGKDMMVGFYSSGTLGVPPNGTVKIVINLSGSPITVVGKTIPAGELRVMARYGGAWYSN